MIKAKHILVGSGVAIALFAIYNAIQKSNEPKIYYRAKLYKGYNARTIPPFGIYILESEKDNIALLEHEKIHWKQYQKRGLINFYNEYANQFSHFGYDKMPMEIEARTNESEY